MSSPLSASPSPTSGSDNNNNNNNNTAVSQGANYFFGFLITFVILLLVFVACGIGSRRTIRFTRMRPRLRGDLATWDPARDDPSLQPEPTFWEAWLVEGSPRWSTMTPLSASIAQTKQAMDTPTSSWISRQRQRRNIASPRRASFFRVPWLGTSQKETNNSSLADGRSPQNLAIATVIRMPNISRSYRYGDQDRLEEYQIGVEYVPWMEGESS